MTADVRDMLAAHADPADHLSRLVLADWLEERGYPMLGFAYRWAGMHGRFPRCSPRGRLFVWSTLRRGQHKAAWPHQLPRLVLAQLRPAPIRSEYRCRSLSAAFAALAGSLERLAVPLRFPEQRACSPGKPSAEGGGS